MRRLFFCVLAFLLVSTALTCFSQQTDIREYSVIPMFTYFSTPSLNLTTRGFNGDIARNVRPWLTLGFDFSTSSGDSTLIPSYLNAATQARLAHLLPPGVPASAVAVPYGTSISTYQAGPQVNIRKLRKFTFGVRPALGVLHVKFQANPNPASAPLVAALMGGKLSASDNAVFYGFGGSVTWEATPHFGLRFAADLAHYNFFGDLLNGGRNTVRVSVGPKFSFGKNILQK